MIDSGMLGNIVIPGGHGSCPKLVNSCLQLPTISMASELDLEPQSRWRIQDKKEDAQEQECRMPDSRDTWQAELLHSNHRWMGSMDGAAFLSAFLRDIFANTYLDIFTPLCY